MMTLNECLRLSEKILEVVSNLDRAKWYKYDEAKEIILIDEKEVSKLF